MKGNNLAMAAVGLVVVGLAVMVPVIGTFFLAPLGAAVIGAVAAWQASKGADNASRAGLKSGAVVGVGAFIGSVVAISAFATFLGADPAVQEFVRNSEPHPEARIPYELMEPVAAAAGLIIGLIVGAVNFGASTVAGLLAGLVAELRRNSQVGRVAD